MKDLEEIPEYDRIEYSSIIMKYNDQGKEQIWKISDLWPWLWPNF